MTKQRIGAALCALATVGLAGCGGGSSPEGAPVTVTVTPTVTSTSKPKAGTTTKAAPASVRSEVRGRSFDFGTAVDVRRVGETTVLTLDRWTYKGLDDAKLAREGLPVRPFKGTPYTNQNSRLDYDIPLAETARILYHHCVAAGEPLQTRSADAKELAGLDERERLLVVKLDDRGRAVAIDNLPGCPG
jgi:hypothetical protein